jgi:hypothetical protein
MITLAYTQKNYDVEYQDDLYNFELRSYYNIGYDDLTVYLDGNDVTEDAKTQEVIEYFEDNLEAE